MELVLFAININKNRLIDINSPPKPKKDDNKTAGKLINSGFLWILSSRITGLEEYIVMLAMLSSILLWAQTRPRLFDQSKSFDRRPQRLYKI